MSTKHKILDLLSDGKFHSGTDMGNKLGMSRAAINKAVKSLSESGIDIHRVSGRGYRMAEAMQPLDKPAILKYLHWNDDSRSDQLYLFDDIDSTSYFLGSLPASEQTAGSVCIAEAQHGGRGRRGRTWVSTPFRNIMMSMLWQFDCGAANLAGLSLAAGVAVVEALHEVGLNNVGLKWPNDILWDGRKLAGLLLDVQGEVAGPSRVILGLGINVSIAEKDAGDIDQPWIDIKSIGDNVVDRNKLIAVIVKKFENMFTQYEAAGFEAFAQSWQAAHVFHGKKVRLVRGNEVLTGVVEGVDANGALKLRNAAGELNIYHSGEVSLRAVEYATTD